ncbi:MAG: hypothetical protein OEZ58_04625 [Gammaproteobacteria bacterium]|nr:hypothetical protein [Gammaproteobacteria bacterium]MDH5728249.1 hypothetical protein [Gammaproteobacteria bacterium]
MIRKTITYLASLTLFACANHPTYYPEEAELALFKNTGESEFKMAKNGIERGYAASGLFAVSDRFFGLAKYSLSRHGNCDTCTTNQRDYLEAAVGLGGLNLGKRRGELLMGAGSGKTVSIETADPLSIGGVKQASADYYRSYLQYNLALMETQYLLAAATLRGAAVMNTTYELRDVDTQNLLTVDGKRWAAFIEPAATLKAHWNGVSIYWQLGLSFPISGDTAFNHDRAWSVAGLSYRLDLF